MTAPKPTPEQVAKARELCSCAHHAMHVCNIKRVAAALAEAAEQEREALDAADTLIAMTFDLDKTNPFKRAEQKAAYERYIAIRKRGARGGK